MGRCTICGWWHTNYVKEVQCRVEHEAKTRFVKKSAPASPKRQIDHSVYVFDPTPIAPQYPSNRVSERIDTPRLPVVSSIPSDGSSIPAHFQDDLARMSHVLNWICTVCYETMDERNFHLTPCFHKVCRTCMDRLTNPRCPVCRTDITP